MPTSRARKPLRARWSASACLTAAERAQIVEAFDAIREDAAAPAFYDGATDEDVHTLVIRKLKERVGALADKIHTGRSRNEQVSLDTRLWLRERDRRAQAPAGRVDGRAGGPRGAAIRTPSFPATRTCGARRRCCGRTTCWRISRCSRATVSGFEQATRRADVMPLGSGALAGLGLSVRPRSDRRGISGFPASRATAWTFRRTAISCSTSCTPPPSPCCI